MEEEIMARQRAGKNKASNSIDACINTAGIFPQQGVEKRVRQKKKEQIVFEWQL